MQIFVRTHRVFFPEVYGDVSKATMGMDVIVFCRLAVSQATSMQRTTFSLPLRSSPTTLSGKTSISGCCCSEARSCARWQWCFVLILLYTSLGLGSYCPKLAYSVCWQCLSLSFLFIHFLFNVCHGFPKPVWQYPWNNQLKQGSSYTPVFLFVPAGLLVIKLHFSKSSYY